jgi:membrane protein YqaA with SNARE-associated domain
MLGYAIGYFLYESLGLWIIQHYGLQSSFAQFQTNFSEWGFWIIALKGLTPIPYKLVTISSGVAQFSFYKFILASIACRAFRFYLLAFVLYRWGPWARSWIERYLSLFFFSAILVLIVGFVIVKVLI